WRDSGGALRVGPESAGAEPGPACYGRGGERPTVTDANLLLGRLPERIAGGLEVDPSAAGRGLDGIEPEGAVAGGNPGVVPALGEADLGYAGQSFELTVPLGEDLAGAFHRAHEARYGYADRARPVELVAVRTAEVRAGPELRLPPAEPLEARGPALIELEGA